MKALLNFVKNTLEIFSPTYRPPSMELNKSEFRKLSVIEIILLFLVLLVTLVVIIFLMISFFAQLKVISSMGLIPLFILK